MARKKAMSAKRLTAEMNGIRLSAHEKLCAERMKTLNDSITEMKKEVKSLRVEVSKGKGAISVLIFLGTIIAGVMGYFKWSG